MDKVSDLWWLDLKGSPAFESAPQFGTYDRSGLGSRSSEPPRSSYTMGQTPIVGASGYAANSRSAQVNPPSFQIKQYAPMAPGLIHAHKFVSGTNVPSQGPGIHFHVYSSGHLLDFLTPAATITPKECALYSLDLGALRWQKVAEGREVFKLGYRWHYCTMNEDGTKAWLMGCPTDAPAMDVGANGLEEQLSDIMEIDLRKYGFLGNNLTPEPRAESAEPLGRARRVETPSKGLGADLAKGFNKTPESGSGSDFVVTALSGDPSEEDLLGSALIRASDVADGDQTWLSPDSPTSPPIHVHRLILYLRWPHFARLWDSHMAEFHNKKMHIPEPYSVVKAFLYYLYTDRIDVAPEDEGIDGPSSDLADIAGLLVMSNIYNIPHLRLLCVNRLSRDLDVDHACIIWYCAGLASEEWLRKRTAGFCLTHWGRIVRTTGFLRLPRSAIVELSQEIDTEGRVVGGEELDMFEGGRYLERRKDSISSNVTQSQAEDAEEDDGMDMN